MLKHELSGKAFHLHSNGPVDAGARTCDPDGCPYTFRSWDWYAAYMPHWAIDSWHHSELHLKITAYTDGCNVRGANFHLSDQSFAKWFADSVVWNVTAIGSPSPIPGAASGCRDCCPHAECVDFIVNIELSYNWVSVDVMGPYRVTISGDGSAPIIQKI